MRCFVAIEINESCRSALADAINRLRQCAGNHKWVSSENLHMTLKFIGNIDEDGLPCVLRALGHAVRGIEPFTMKVEGLGSFPAKGRPRVIFARVQEQSGTLLELAGRVESEMEDKAGIKPEKRRFIPHITLGRVRRRLSCPRVEKLSERLENRDFGTVDVNRLVLMRSDTAPEGPRYTVMDSFYYC